MAWGHRRGWPPEAYWASWADAANVGTTTSSDHGRHHVSNCRAHCHGVFRRVAGECGTSGPRRVCGRAELVRLEVPDPPDHQSAEPGEWQHGRQYHASSSSEHHVWKTVVHAQSSAADQAHLRSDSGPCAGQVLIGCPASPEFEVKPHLFRTIVRERMRLPLINEARCECGGSIDCRGRHRRACTRSGRLRSRAVSTEKSLARVRRETGATVRCNPKFRDLIVNVLATDERAIEVLFSGQQMNHGAQLAC